MIDFAYSKLNLKFNPFGEAERQQRIDTALPRCDLPQLASFISNHTDKRRAIQFIGRPGSGKSTHLLLLASELTGFHYSHIPMETTRAIPVARQLMVDEAQRLTRAQRKSLFRTATQVILGTHRCFQRKLQSRGFQVVSISFDELPNVDWLQQTMNRKIADAKRDKHKPVPNVSSTTAANLLQEFGNNIRAIERKLFEVVYALNTEPAPQLSI